MIYYLSTSFCSNAIGISPPVRSAWIPSKRPQTDMPSSASTPRGTWSPTIPVTASFFLWITSSTRSIATTFPAFGPSCQRPAGRLDWTIDYTFFRIAQTNHLLKSLSAQPKPPQHSWQSSGRQFDPVQLHQIILSNSKGVTVFGRNPFAHVHLDFLTVF